MSQTAPIIKRINELTDFIGRAQDKLQQGEVSDVSHLDNEVKRLCDQTLSLKAADALQVQPSMGEMITKLEQFAQALKDFQTKFNPSGSSQ